MSVLASVASLAASSPCSLHKISAGDSRKYILENRFLRVTIDPQRAGGVEEILFRPKKTTLTLDPETARGVSFMDRIYRQVAEDGETLIETEYFNEYTFSARVETQTPECVALSVSSPGRSPSFAWLKLTKVYTLRKDACELQVRHTLANGSATAQSAGIWVNTFIRARGMFEERNTFYAPTPVGVRAITHPGRAATEQGDWVMEPAGNWKAVVGTGSRCGMVVVVDQQHVSSYYDWYSKFRTTIMSTFEWIMREQTIPAQGRFSTVYRLIPVSQFRRVDGVLDSRIPCGIGLAKERVRPGEAVKVQMALASPRREQVRVRLRVAHQSEDLVAKSIALAPGQTVVNECSLSPKAPGAYRIDVTVEQNGKSLGQVTRTFAVGDATLERHIRTLAGEKVGREFLFPIMHQRLPGGEKIKFRAVRGASTAAPKQAKEAGPKLSAKERNRRRAHEMYPPLDFINDISEEVVTPHFPWLKPRAQGKLKVLYLVLVRYQTSTTKRGPIELAQRMSVEYKYVPLLQRILGRRGAFGMHRDTRGKDLEPYTIDVVQEEARKGYDVIVVDSLNFQGVQKELTQCLLDAVAAGKGLVLKACTNLPKDIEDVLSSNIVSLPDGFHAVPAMNRRIPPRRQMRNYCRLASHGKGRVAAIDSRKNLCPCVPRERAYESHPNCYGKEYPYWEYLMIPFIKAIVWATSDEPLASVEGVEVRGESLHARVAGTGEGAARLHITFKDAYDQTDAARTYPISLRPGGSALELPLPRMSGGFHVAHCRLTDESGGVHDFGAYAFETPSDCGIDEVALPQEAFRAGEPAQCTVRLRNVPTGYKLIGEVEDTYGRIVVRQEQDLTEGQTSAKLAFAIQRPLAILHRLFISIREGDRVVARKMHEFSMPWEYPPDDELMAYTWYGQAMGLKRWKDCGFDSVIFSFRRGGNGILKALVNMGLRPWGYGLAYATGNPGHKGEASYNGPDLVREPCFSDPAWWAKYRETCLRHLRDNRHVFYGVRDYQMCDEMRLGPAVCSSEHCLAAFREYLQTQYDSLAALNREWETSFKSWDALKPIPLTEVSDEKNNMPQWLDHRLSMNTVFRDWVGRTKEILCEVNPDATCGLSGTQIPDTTYDWWQLMKVIDCLGNYGGIQQELVASFRASHARNGQWTGGYVPTEVIHERHQRGAVWHGVFKQDRGYFFFHASSAGTSLLGDLRLAPNMQIAVEELANVKRGIAKLIFSSDAASDGIGMHYSQSSLFCAMGTIGAGFWRESLDSWKFLLHDLGLSFKFVSYEQLANGKLATDTCKIFILPFSVSISPEETQTLREFVRSGGTVLADYAPGLYDGRGKRGENLALMDLFGARRRGNEIRATGCELKVKASPNERLTQRELLIRYGESGVLRAGAVTHGDTGEPTAPALLYNRFGKGKAILMNCAISGYAQTKLGGTGGELSEVTRGDPKITTPTRELIEEILSGCDVTRRVRVTTSNGADFQPLTRTFRFSHGSTEYVGLLRPDRRPGAIQPSDYVPVTIDFGQRSHLYDVRQGKYLGLRAKVSTKIASGIAQLYALLPYRVQGVTVAASKECQAGEPLHITVRVTAVGATPGTHVVHVEAIGPDGQARAHYASNAKLHNGAGTLSVPTALNDPKGRWKLGIRDVATGVSGEAMVELR